MLTIARAVGTMANATETPIVFRRGYPRSHKPPAVKHAFFIYQRVVECVREGERVCERVCERVRERESSSVCM